jgi:membrane associated rhomboid family serine protease
MLGGRLALSPNIAWYVGISGALFGLFCAGALSQFTHRPLQAGVLLLGMAAIIACTSYAGALPGELIGFGGRVVPQAHLYGALGGAIFILARASVRKCPSWTQPLCPNGNDASVR